MKNYVDARELRIGNLVNHISFGIVLIRGINEESLKCVYEGNTYWEDLKFYEPIELNEDILIKAGFMVEHGCIYTKDQIFINMGNHGIVHILGTNNGYTIPVQIHGYKLHQLQNLYFDLYNRELEINL